MTQEPEFQGRIGKTYKDSDPWWPPTSSRHDGKTPNVVVMLFDDTGFGHFGCYGSTIETPNIDKLAASGIVLDQAYHMGSMSGAVCSPSRTMIDSGL